MRHTHRLLCRHILAVRSIPILAHCKAVLIFESNLAFESQHLLHALEANGMCVPRRLNCTQSHTHTTSSCCYVHAMRRKNWVSLSEGQQGSLGWLTTNERKVRVCTPITTGPGLKRGARARRNKCACCFARP